jgi:dTDP-4-dehydrorhamnose reductase
MTTPANAPLAWVTGAGGLIGNYLVQLAPRFAPGWRVRGLKRADLDLTDLAALDRAFAADSPRLVIHCAAMSRSPDCQARPAEARRVNVDVTRHLAGLCASARLVFFSTDLVFDGRQGGYAETDALNPLSIYGETKVAAEQTVLAHPRHLVIRTSLNGGTSPAGDRAFNEEMRRAWAAGRTLNLFTDEFRSPTHACVTARAVWELAPQDVSGILHVAGAERLSRLEIGQLVAARCPKLQPRIVAGSLRDYQGAPRPPDTSLNCARAQARLSFRLPGLREWLAANPDARF